MMVAWTGFTGSYAADMYAPAQPVDRGSILVASDSLLDPRFARSVVLITDYGVDGAVGVILNR
ncbi:MAG: YqgE/AlgH family protein, partial [Gammaproteobacteria bacterium]|nr:YqgE/AlgH family protein [Gammaproteobacteria bacterium]